MSGSNFGQGGTPLGGGGASLPQTGSIWRTTQGQNNINAGALGNSATPIIWRAGTVDTEVADCFEQNTNNNDFFTRITKGGRYTAELCVLCTSFTLNANVGFYIVYGSTGFAYTPGNPIGCAKFDSVSTGNVEESVSINAVANFIVPPIVSGSNYIINVRAFRQGSGGTVTLEAQRGHLKVTRLGD